MYKWNVVPNIDSWYRYGGHCDAVGDAYCVNVYSANYGDPGWWGHTSHYTSPIQLSLHFSRKYTSTTTPT